MAACCKNQGKTLCDRLHEFYAEYGYYYDAQASYKLQGIAGKEKIQAIMTALREQKAAFIPEPAEVLDFARASQTCRGRTCSSTALRTAPGSPSARPALNRSSRCTARLSRRTRRPPRRSSPRYGRSSSRCLISKLVGDCAEFARRMRSMGLSG